MADIPLTPLIFKYEQFRKNSGAIASLCKFYFYEAGTEDPIAVYTDVDGTVEAANPYVLNSVGRAADTLYMPPEIGLKIIFTDENGPASPTPIPISGVTISTDDMVSDPGSVAFRTLAEQITQNIAEDVVDSFEITTESYVTAKPNASPNPCTIFMPLVADTPFPICIVHVGTAGVPVQLVAAGADTFMEDPSQLFTIPEGTSPVFSGAWFAGNGATTWRLLSRWTA